MGDTMFDDHGRLLVLIALVAACVTAGSALALIVDHEPAGLTLVGGEAGTTVGEGQTNTVAVCAGNETFCNGSTSLASPADPVLTDDRRTHVQVGGTAPGSASGHLAPGTNVPKAATDGRLDGSLDARLIDP